MARPADPHARSALEAAARAEFVKHGIVRARIEDITAACGLSKGAFYLHYPSKEALFEALVRQLEAAIVASITARQSEQARMLAEKGRVTRKDLGPGSPFLARMAEFERVHDRQVLELLWNSRDVVSVALHGAQGTPFQEWLWAVVDREALRVEGMIDQMKAFGVCRPDIANEVVSATVVGTWILLIRRMASLKTPPDFDYWVGAIQRLITEGTAPRTAPVETASPTSPRAKAERPRPAPSRPHASPAASTPFRLATREDRRTPSPRRRRSRR